MIDRESLLKSRLAERVVSIPGVGDVRIRSLSGKEVAQLPAYREDTEGGEDFALTRGVVDPPLTVEDVHAWRESATHGELVLVLSEIFDLSGLGDDSLKEAVKSFRGRPGETP